MGRSAVVCGIGSFLPPGLLTNNELAARLGVTEEWIRSRTGIDSRRVLSPGSATSDLAVEAGRRALASAGNPTVDAVILATTTPDHLCPATAPDVATRLDLGCVPAFDLSIACAGFLYGLATASGLIASGSAHTVLLIAADSFTTIVDPMDRGCAVVFGDGAGAVVLRSGRSGEPGAVTVPVLGSDGGGSHLIQVPAGGSRQKPSGETPKPEERFLHMQGRMTFRHAVERMTESSRMALERAGWQPGDVDRLGAHQANARIVDAVADQLGITEERGLSNIAGVGNTGAGSIPLLLSQSIADGALRPGHRLLLTAFGAGFGWGATTMVWPELGPCRGADLSDGIDGSGSDLMDEPTGRSRP
ncbi:beta-ketoacyl-ACP synthase III [Streptomyces sp. NPDC098077]|uniref:beta-ketoacyl-ACP synthase III n=1 Tax=Streptomyces sp. NPDC098077 TaxID=3366093 RepID=UPI0037FF15B0